MSKESHSGAATDMKTQKSSYPIGVEDTVHIETASAQDDDKDGTNYTLIDPEVAKYASQHAIQIDDETNKRLKKLINHRILLVMVVTYFLQALDKSTLSFAAIMGIREDTHLVGQNYSWLTTCIYLAVLVVEYPTNWIIQRVPIAKYLAANIILWGATLAMHAICKNFAGLVTVRTILGALEACCQPTFVLLSGTWFKREEQAATAIWWFSMNGLQQILGGLLGYGFSHIPETSSLKSWQALFITYGSITVIWGLFVLWWMPDSLTKAKCFSEEDKKLMIERVRHNQTGIQNRIFRKDQVVDAFKDPQTYAFAIIQFCTTIPSAGIGAFSGILIQSFGFGLLQTQLLSMGSGVVQIIIMSAAVYFDRKYKQVTLVMIGGVIPAIAGTIVFLTVPWSYSTRIGLLLAYYTIWCFYAASGLALSLVSRNVGGQTKKATVIATTFVCWAAGNSVGPQVFKSTDAPRYFTAFAVQMACWVILLITLLVLRTYYKMQNKRKDQLVEQGTVVADTELVHGFEDVTDRANINFRYVY